MKRLRPLTEDIFLRWLADTPRDWVLADGVRIRCFETAPNGKVLEWCPLMVVLGNRPVAEAGMTKELGDLIAKASDMRSDPDDPNVQIMRQKLLQATGIYLDVPE